MRRNLLIVTALFGVLGLTAQSAVNNDMKDIKVTKPTYASEAVTTGGSNEGPALQSRTTGVGEVIGHTTYDLQTNAANPDRVRVDEDGNVQITWTGSSLYSLSFDDRGSFYRFKAANGDWTDEPTERLEGTTRTGWPANDFLGNGGEIVISHDPSEGNYNLVSMIRDTRGTGNWTGPTAISNNGIWPRIATSGDNVYVVYTHNTGADDNGDDNFTMFAMSSDNGATWDTTDMVLPGISAENGYTKMTADAYAIGAKDSIVAVVAGASTNDAVLWKSYDYGQTWERTVMMDIGLSGYNWTDESHISDVDGDGVGDTIYTHDEAYEMLIDKDGMVHVWMGSMLLIDDDPTALWGYFPFAGDLLYWNENLGYDGAEQVESAFIRDIDGSNFLELGADAPGYGPGIISMPAAAYDEDQDQIYLVFAMMVENSDAEGDYMDQTAESYRDLYGVVGARYEYDTTISVETSIYDTVETIDTTYDMDTMVVIDTLDSIAVYTANTDTTFDTTSTVHDTLIVDADTTFDTTVVVIDTVIGMDTTYNSDTTVYDTTVTYSTDTMIDTTVVITDTVIMSSQNVTLETFAWSDAVNLTNTALIQVENAFPSVADRANGKVHVMWQSDDEPGHALGADPADDIRENDIRYMAFDYSDFAAAAPVASFEDTTISCERAVFTNTSTGEVWESLWTFGDGFGSSDQNPSHTYQVPEPYTNTFNVCLNVSNPWGSDEACKDVTLTCLSVDELSNNDKVAVYPNPTTGVMNLDINLTNAGNVSVEVTNLLGSVVYLNNLNQVAGAQTLDIDLSKETAGVYFVNVTVGEEVITKKVTLK